MTHNNRQTTTTQLLTNTWRNKQMIIKHTNNLKHKYQKPKLSTHNKTNKQEHRTKENHIYVYTHMFI